MREIKFRVWDGQEMIYDYQLFTFFHGQLVCEGDTFPLQYTDLKDKNGVEIYERDILDVRGEKGEVYYDDNNVCFAVDVDIDYNPCIGRYEVIGNIYETPELLK